MRRGDVCDSPTVSSDENWFLFALNEIREDLYSRENSVTFQFSSEHAAKQEGTVVLLGNVNKWSALNIRSESEKEKLAVPIKKLIFLR